MARAGTATAIRQRQTPAAPVGQGQHPSILADIHRPGAALAIWQRVNPCADAAEPALPIDVDMAADSVASAIGPALAHAGYQKAMPGLVADITALAAQLARLADASRLRIRLDRVTDDACRHFHADYVTLRLLTT